MPPRKSQTPTQTLLAAVALLALAALLHVETWVAPSAATFVLTRPPNGCQPSVTMGWARCARLALQCSKLGINMFYQPPIAYSTARKKGERKHTIHWRLRLRENRNSVVVGGCMCGDGKHVVFCDFLDRDTCVNSNNCAWSGGLCRVKPGKYPSLPDGLGFCPPSCIPTQTAGCNPSAGAGSPLACCVPANTCTFEANPKVGSSSGPTLGQDTYACV